jgi:hypothetical protein
VFAKGSGFREVDIQLVSITENLFQGVQGGSLKDEGTCDILRVAECVQIPFFTADGGLESPAEVDRDFVSLYQHHLDDQFYLSGMRSSGKDSDIPKYAWAPVHQNYSNEFTLFGYRKLQVGPGSRHLIRIKAEIKEEVLREKIFGPFEVLRILERTIDSLMRMKSAPVKDFECFLALQEVDNPRDLHKSGSLFMPQEMFYGKTICDLYLNKAERVK